MIPPFYPDQARPYISESEAQSLFQRLDDIFLKTGSPFFPLMIIPFLGMIIVTAVALTTWLGGVVTVVIVPILFFVCIAIIMILGSKRKREVTEVIEQWNRTEGVPKGIYFALGSDNGISPDEFWLGVYPRRIRVGHNSHIVVTSKYSLSISVFLFNLIFFSPLIHLYMNPSARQEWCRRNGVEFLYPSQQQQYQPQPQQPIYQAHQQHPYHQSPQQHYFPQQQQYGVPVQPPTYSQNYGGGQSGQPPPYQEVTDVKY